MVKFEVKKLENAIFTVKRSILLRFSNFIKLAFTELSDETNHMFIFYVRLIGIAQWYLENEEFYFG